MRIPFFIAPLLACPMSLPGGADAACSRPVQVPVSATGHSVEITDGVASGIYPELLRKVAPQEKCQFVVTPVPRARLDKLFQTGKADMIVASTRSERRDEFGVFIPMVRSRATLISLEYEQRPPFKNMQELLDHKETRLLVVRGFDYGNAYLGLIDIMAKENRVLEEADPSAVARLLKLNPSDVTIMVPTILFGIMQEDSRLRDKLDQLRVEPLEELGWGESGVYISTNTLDSASFRQLRTAMLRASASGVVYKGFQSYYPPALLKDSVRPM